MLKIVEYAKISKDTYSASTSFNFLTKDILKKHNSKLPDGFYRVIDVVPSYTTNPAFFPALYVKYKFGQAVNAVVAIRGSSNIKNYEVDVHTWYKDILRIASSDELPAYYMPALNFFREARAYINHYIGEPRVTLTGHSLGGALAQSIVGVGGKPFYAVTFNSPGIGHFKAINVDFAPWVKNINSRYGFINKIGKPFGEIVYVDVLEKEAEAKAAWAALRDEAETVNSLEQDKDVLTDTELLNRIDIDALTARNDFMISVVPQHRIENIVRVVDGI